MEPRALFVVLVRVGALFFALMMLAHLVAALGYVLDDVHGVPWGVIVGPAASLAAAVFLGLRAEWLASRFYGDARPPAAAGLEADLVRVACLTVGLYAWLCAVMPLGTLVHATARETGIPWGAAAQFVVYVAFGLVLVLGPGRTWRGVRKTFAAPRPDQGGGTAQSP